MRSWKACSTVHSCGVGITQNTSVIITRVVLLSKNQSTWLCGLKDMQNRLLIARGEVRGGN